MGRAGTIAAATAAIGAVAGGLAYGSLWPTSQLFGRTLIAGKDPVEVALTFDDGPNDAATPHLLDVLAKHNVRGSFFMIGCFARQRAEMVRRVAAEGHLIGNHTMDHPRLALESAGSIRQQLADCSSLLEDLTGTPVRFFRPPFGFRRPVVLRIARELGLRPVMWNVTCHDWDPIGAEKILSHMEAGIARNRGAGGGSNILLHDGGQRGLRVHRMDTVQAVDQLLTRARGSQRWITVDSWAAVES